MLSAVEYSRMGLKSAKTILKKNRFIVDNYRRIRYHRLNLNTEVLQANDQVQLTMKWLKTLPNQFDVVIGVPRAGVLIANTIALQFCIPWSLPSCFIENKQVFYSSSLKTPKIRRVLIVEDCVTFGRQLNAIKETIKAKYPELVVKTGSLLVSNRDQHSVDYYYRNIEKQAVEKIWDLLKIDKRYVVDMDGVLNHNPSPDDTSNVEKYVEFIRNAEPYLLLRVNIDTIITARPEWTRDLTEKWLRQHNIQYNKLVMRQGDSFNPSFNDAVSHKISTLKTIKPELFWESEANQARVIHRKTGIKVLCTDNMTLFGL